jgi:hypothetical protein
MSIGSTTASNKMRESIEQIRQVDSFFKQITETARLSWIDNRRNEFYSKHIDKQLDNIREIHTMLNMVLAEISRMESSLNRYK